MYFKVVIFHGNNRLFPLAPASGSTESGGDGEREGENGEREGGDG